MKVFVNGKQVLELNETQKKVILNDIPLEVFEDDMCRRCKYWLESPCEKLATKKEKEIRYQLKSLNLSSLPSSALDRAAQLAELTPPKQGLDDIQNPLPVGVGNKSFELSEQHLKIWRHSLSKSFKGKDEDFNKEEEKVLEQRASWILSHKYERCMERLKNAWLPKLAERFDSIPADEDALAELIFSQPDYKDRSTRDLEEKEKEGLL